MPKLWLTIGGYAGCVLLSLWLWAEKEAHKASLAEAETDKALAIVASAEATREALEQAHATELESQRQLQIATENARASLAEAVSGLESQLASQNDTITRLEFEADIDEIPSYADCSIVYIPSRVLHADDCGEAGPGGGQDYRVCTGPEGLNEADSAFTNITVGDTLRLWGSDRAALGRCNAQLAAIEALEVPE